MQDSNIREEQMELPYWKDRDESSAFQNIQSVRKRKVLTIRSTGLFWRTIASERQGFICDGLVNKSSSNIGKKRKLLFFILRWTCQISSRVYTTCFTVLQVFYFTLTKLRVMRKCFYLMPTSLYNRQKRTYKECRNTHKCSQKKHFLLEGLYSRLKTVRS